MEVSALEKLRMALDDAGRNTGLTRREDEALTKLAA